MNVDFEQQDIIIEFSSEGVDGKSVHPTGEWDDSIEYHALDLVTYEGSSYIALMDVPEGISPIHTEYWMINSSNKAAYWGTIEGTLSNQTDLQSILDSKVESSDLGTMAMVDDAPSDDKEYIRKNSDWVEASEGRESSWGNITGTLSNQTDLQTALNSKANSNAVYSKNESDILLSKKANTSDLGALSDHDSVNYETEVTNKPSLGAMAAVNDAPSDNKEYVRKNKNWVVKSGIASVAWGDITGSLSNQTDLSIVLNGKQNTLTFDNVPTSGSNNPVKSGGVYSALNEKADTSSLGDLARLNNIDYTGNRLTNKPTLGLLASKDSVDYATEVVNKPSLGTMAAANDAPSDDKEYVRKNAAWVESAKGGESSWGNITGSISDQTDLQTALDAKADSSGLGTMSSANYTISTTDLSDGESPLATGEFYFYYVG